MPGDPAAVGVGLCGHILTGVDRLQRTDLTVAPVARVPPGVGVADVATANHHDGVLPVATLVCGVVCVVCVVCVMCGVCVCGGGTVQQEQFVRLEGLEISIGYAPREQVARAYAARDDPAGPRRPQGSG